MRVLHYNKMDARVRATGYDIDVRTIERRMLSGALSHFSKTWKMACGSWAFVTCSPPTRAWKLTIAAGLPPEITCPVEAAAYVVEHREVA